MESVENGGGMPYTFVIEALVLTSEGMKTAYRK
jgi:hypothetical protein